MKTKRRIWLLPLIAALLAGGLLYAFAPRPVPVELTRVTRGPMRVTVDDDGRTRIKERYIVSAPLGGQLRRIELRPGDPVVAGKTLIATIEPPAPSLLDPRTRAQLEARLQAADLQAQQAGPRLERVRAAQQLAQSELERATALMEQKAISVRELELAREAARAAAEDLRAAEYGRQIAGYELEQARAALLRSSLRGGAGDHSWELCVTSPIHGRVLRLFHESAAVVTPGASLVELGDPADLEAVVDVLSSDAVRIEPGARVLFEQWGGATPLEGRVRVVEPAGFLKISALGVEEQRVNVIVDFVSPPGARRTLGDAYRVEARIVIWEAENVLKLPVGALFRSGGEWSVFVARQGRARLTRVEVGHSNGRDFEILRGVAAGDEIVTHPSDKVMDGAAISVRARP